MPLKGGSPPSLAPHISLTQHHSLIHTRIVIPSGWTLSCLPGVERTLLTPVRKVRESLALYTLQAWHEHRNALLGQFLSHALHGPTGSAFGRGQRALRFSLTYLHTNI